MTSAAPGGGITTIVAGYDDYGHLRACRRAFPDPNYCTDLIDQLGAFGVTYLNGASGDYGLPSPYITPRDVNLRHLVLRLAQAPNGRVRDALVGLLLRRPECASTVKDLINSPEVTANTRASLAARLLAAAALQRTHKPAFNAHEPRYMLIDVADLTTAEGLPSADDDGGRPLLAAIQNAVSSRSATIDYVVGWESAARHTLQEIAWARVNEQSLALD